jgi:hypothetical protein
MDSTALELITALAMLALPTALIVWFFKNLASESERRMTLMMDRVGLVAASLDDQRDITDARARCRRCPCEGLCERWLSGEVSGENTFCPNASAFDRLVRTVGSAA